jgi:chromosome segregation ATPase
MISGEKKTIEPGTELFLDDALKLASEVVALRTRLASAQRERAELLDEREVALAEGRDLLPKIKLLHLDIEKLPSEINQLEGQVGWLVDRGIEKLNYENSQIAARQYMKSRDILRQALERFREEFIAVQANIKAGEDLGRSLAEAPNAMLGEIEKLLGNVHFSRVKYQTLLLPPLDAELVRRNQIFAAIDRWISGLH